MTFLYTNAAGEIIKNDDGSLMTGVGANDCCCQIDCAGMTIDFTITQTATCDFTFNATATPAAECTGGSIVSWEWDFGDGNTDSGQNVSHDYNTNSGSWNVSLTVTDSCGCQISLIKPVACATTNCCCFNPTGISGWNVTLGGVTEGTSSWNCSCPSANGTYFVPVGPALGCEGILDIPMPDCIDGGGGLHSSTFSIRVQVILSGSCGLRVTIRHRVADGSFVNSKFVGGSYLSGQGSEAVHCNALSGPAVMEAPNRFDDRLCDLTAVTVSATTVVN